MIEFIITHLNACKLLAIVIASFFVLFYFVLFFKHQRVYWQKSLKHGFLKPGKLHVDDSSQPGSQWRWSQRHHSSLWSAMMSCCCWQQPDSGDCVCYCWWCGYGHKKYFLLLPTVCDSLNGRKPLTTWFPVGRCCLWRFRGCDLAGGVVTGGAVEGSYTVHCLLLVTLYSGLVLRILSLSTMTNSNPCNHNPKQTLPSKSFSWTWCFITAGRKKPIHTFYVHLSQWKPYSQPAPSFFHTSFLRVAYMSTTGKLFTGARAIHLWLHQ